MADRACRNFQPNIFNTSKCQNCYKLQEAHRTSQTSLESKNSGGNSAGLVTGSASSFSSSSIKPSKLRTVVKSGLLSIFSCEAQDKSPNKTGQEKWQRRWFVLNSTGVVEYFIYDELKGGGADTSVGTFNLDDCLNMFVGEVDTSEPFSLGVKFMDVTYYLKADNRLEMDNWSRVLKPFVQAAKAYPFHRGSRSSFSSSDSVELYNSVPASSLGRVPSVGKSSPVGRPATPPRSSSTHPKTKFGPVDQHPSVESLKSQLEKLREENRQLREQQPATVKQRESVHNLEQDLKTKTSRINELETDNAKCKDYQKAVIFQEKELQEARGTMKDLQQQLAEAEKKLKHQNGKVAVHAKDLAEAKADLEEANSIISIHKANIESLKGELSVKNEASERRGRIILTDEEPESDQVFNVKSIQASGEDKQKKDIETKLGLLMQKLKQNERELMMKTRELEKANESRSKVAKYTRSLLQELETKLYNNERKLAETEYQLVNNNLELEYEKEQKSKLEKDKDQLNMELEKLLDEKKKSRLPKEAVYLMNEARKESKSENVSEMETKLLETENKLHDVEHRLALEKTVLLEEIESVEGDMKAMELISNECQAKLRESQVSLLAANRELHKSREETRDLRRELDRTRTSVSDVTAIEGLLNEKKEKLKSLNKTVTELRIENTDLNQKGKELENKLDSMDEKLCQSLKKQFAVTEDNERHLKEKKALENRVLDLEEKVLNNKDKISALKMKLSEVICVNDSKFEADHQKIDQLEETVNDKNELLQELESRLAAREQEIMELKQRQERETAVKQSNEQKHIAHELETLLEKERDLVKRSKEKFDEKNDELKVLKKELSELSKEVAILDANKEDCNRVDDLETKLAEREDKLVEYEKVLQTAQDKILEFQYQSSLGKPGEKEDYLDQIKDLEKKVASLQNEVEDDHEKLGLAEERLLDYEVEEKLLTAELQKCKKENPEGLESRIRELRKQLVGEEKKAAGLEVEHKEITKKLVASEEKVVELAEELAKRLKLEQETAEWIVGVENNLGKTEGDLNNAKGCLLSKAQELEREKTNILDIVELSRKYVSELEASLAEEKCRVHELEKSLEEKQRAGVLGEETQVDEVDGKRKYGLEDRSKVEDIEAKLACCEREKDAEKTRVKELQIELDDTRMSLTEELESAKEAHQKDMKKLSEDTLKVSGAARTEGDELRLRLTSRVITLQSDISELRAAQRAAIEKLKARHKKELENVRREAILETSMKQPIEESEELNVTMTEMETEMKDIVTRYEAQMELLKHNHHREIDKLKRTSESGGGLQTEVVQLQVEMEKMSQKYMEEIEMLKGHHAEELDQLKNDMAMVIQASVSHSPSKDVDSNTQQLKARIKELEEEMEGLSDKYNEDLKIEREAQQKELDQIRDDMMTVIQAIKSQKYELEPEQLEQTKHEYEAKIARMQEEHQQQLKDSQSCVPQEQDDDLQQAQHIKELEQEIARLRNKYESELWEKQTKHEDDMNQLKLDMLVAIQVARSGTASPVTHSEKPAEDTVRQAGIKLSLEEARCRVGELEEENTKIKTEFAEEKDELEKTVKRQEAATMFGLRRNEEMSNKIYQMQKEMEDIDRKYMKEIKMYKDAFEREKDSKSKCGETAALESENDALKLELDELRLKMDEAEVLNQNEIKMYKEKLGEEKLLDVDDLRLQVKGLEDGIEEMKLEHDREMEEVEESHAKTIEHLKSEHEKELRNMETKNSTLGSTKAVAKDEQTVNKTRDLEYKIEELESLLEVKKRRHREEVKRLKERLDEEIQRHTDDMREHKNKLKESDRRGSVSSSTGASEYFRKQVSELRTENKSLKEELEKLRDKAGTAVNRVQKTESQRSHSESDSLPFADDSKLPLRKTTSDSKALEMESTRRPFRVGPREDVLGDKSADGKTPLTRQWSSDKTKTFTRQSSKPPRMRTNLPETRSYRQRRDIL